MGRKLSYKVQNIINKITFGLSEMGPSFTSPDIFYNFKIGINNLKSYFWCIWKIRHWDFEYSLKFQQIFIKKLMERKLEDLEVEETKVIKLEQMRATLVILKRLTEEFGDYYYKKAESILGPRFETDFEFKKILGTDFSELINNLTEEQSAHNTKVFLLEEKLREKDRIKFFKIISEESPNWWS